MHYYFSRPEKPSDLDFTYSGLGILEGMGAMEPTFYEKGCMSSVLTCWDLANSLNLIGVLQRHDQTASIVATLRMICVGFINRRYCHRPFYGVAGKLAVELPEKAISEVKQVADFV